MASLVSWIWSPLSGVLSVIFLIISWGALISVVFAVIGAARRRCRWWLIPVYLAVSAVASLLFRSLFWISDHIAQGDVPSTALFWGAVLVAGFGGIGQGLSLLRETWRATNGVAGPSPPATDHAADHQEGVDRIDWADDLVAQYCAVLEHSRSTPYIPEGALPGSTEDIKQALLIVAAMGQIARGHSEAEITIYRNVYMTLMHVVPDGQALALSDVLAAIARAGGPKNLPRSAVREVAQQIAAALPNDDTVAEGVTLLVEFTQRLEAMLANYRDGCGLTGA